MTSLELAVRFGKTLIIQEMDGVEPVLYPLLRRDLIAQGMHTLTNTIFIPSGCGGKNNWFCITTLLSIIQRVHQLQKCWPLFIEFPWITQSLFLLLSNEWAYRKKAVSIQSNKTIIHYSSVILRWCSQIYTYVQYTHPNMSWLTYLEDVIPLDTLIP